MMADQPVSITNLPDSGSAERVALDMVKMIANTEGLAFYGAGQKASAAWVIRTYAACLNVVKYPNMWKDSLDLLQQRQG